MTQPTLLELRTAARERADQVNSAFISDSELNRYINTAAKELYDILITAFDNDYSVQKKSLTIDGVATAQVTSITCPAGSASGLNSTWFRIHSTENLYRYYVWFNVDSGGTDPAPGGLTGVEVAVTSGDTSTQVATAVASALDGLSYFSASSDSAVVTCTNSTTGICKDATNQGSVPGLSISITTEGHDADRYRMPSDVYKMIGVDAIEGSGDPYPVRPFQFAERNKFKSSFPGYVLGRHSPYRYRMSGGNIILSPAPSPITLVLWYAPYLDTLYSDSDTIEGFNGWEEYIIIRAARFMVSKEEGDTTDLDNELMFLKERITIAADSREADIGSPPADVESDYYDEREFLD